MENLLKKFIRFEDKVWFVDLSAKPWVVDIVAPDGSVRPAIGKDGDFLDLLNEGSVISAPANYIQKK